MYIIVMGTCELVSLVVQQTSTLQRRTSRGCRMASDEEESSTEERWRCRRSWRLLTLLLMVRSQIKKKIIKSLHLVSWAKEKKIIAFLSLSLSLFYLLHFEFLQHPKRKQRREVRWGFNSTRLTRRHEANLPFPCLRLINKLKYRPLKPKGSYVQVQIIFSR